jgi:hypothetical protein
MRRIIPAILLVALLAIGGGLLVNAAYDAGVNSAVTTAVANGQTVSPVVVPPYGYGYGYGYGWHPFGWGFSIFGLFFLFIIFGLIRAIFWGGRRGWGGGPGGWGGPGHHGTGGRYDRNPWIDRFGPSFEEWHRQAHGSSSQTGLSNEPPASNQGSTPA